MRANTNSWHKAMYDELHASTGLDSKQMLQKAKDEVAFILKTCKPPLNSKILDVPCGTGRHSIEFARAGFSVTGIDISKACLKLAKVKVRGRKNLHFKIGDMGNLNWAIKKYDLVTNLFSSFGYFSTDGENFRCLQGMVRALRPGGKLVIQTINRDYLLQIFDPARWGEDEKKFWLESTKYDPKTNYVDSQRIFIESKTKKAHRYYFRMRLYSITEMKKLFLKAGLRSIKIFDGPSGKPASRFKSTHPIYIGTK